MEAPSRVQIAVCLRFGAVPEPCEPEAVLGLALGTLDATPLNAVRHPATKDSCGWYVWGGVELSRRADFFSPMHVKHLPEYAPALVPYLALPPGWRVLLAPRHEDAWYDAALLGV